jgi:hypothetical protein
MDESVIHAIKRWPNVPAVYGWLSLSARGLWRLHPDGQAHQGGPGESITNPQILGFINRNYACDDQGQWFFQNGPQRVYVRLDGAPWIAFADDSNGSIVTHTDKPIEQVRTLCVDSLGQLFLDTELGWALLLDRDLPRFIEGWRTEQQMPLEQWWLQTDRSDDQTHVTDSRALWRNCANPLALRRLDAVTPVAQQLHFVANPQPRND